MINLRMAETLYQLEKHGGCSRRKKCNAKPVASTYLELCKAKACLQNRNVASTESFDG